MKYEMPKLKVKLSKLEIDELRKKRKSRKIFTTFLLVVLFIVGGVAFFVFNLEESNAVQVNETAIESIDVISYKQIEDNIDLSLTTVNEQVECAYSLEEVDTSKLSFKNVMEGSCNLNVPFKKVYVYFKNSEGIVSSPIELNNYVVDFNVKDKYYIPINSMKTLLKDMVVVGDPVVEIEAGSNISLNNYDFSSGVNGTTVLNIHNGTLQQKNIEVTVTNVIVEMPKEFNSKKKFLACEQFTEDEAKLLDEILLNRITEAGYGTRAGAVAAARFLTLEFPYRISYYFENGRLNGTGTHYVDGEGRYYHKGLYLSKSKYAELVPGAKLQGPQMWGCKMRSYEDDRANGYIPGGKYPNGLDCSGFVSWTLYNGGFDVGDGGAGESPYIKGQMTDTGEYKRLTQGMIDRGEVRVGDLLNIYGHIAIIAGDDGENFYVAESLNNYKGVVLKKYSKKKVINSFPYVVLMDSVYESDGNLTNMWY